MEYLCFKHCDCKEVSSVLQIKGTIVGAGQWQTELIISLISQVRMHDTTIYVTPVLEPEMTYPINIQIIQKEENLEDQWITRSKRHSIKYLFFL